MLRGCPFAFADDRESGAVDNEMDGLAPGSPAKFNFEPLTTPRESRVIRNIKADTHHLEDGSKEALGLAEREVEDETEESGPSRWRDQST